MHGPWGLVCYKQETVLVLGHLHSSVPVRHTNGVGVPEHAAYICDHCMPLNICAVVLFAPGICIVVECSA